MKHIYHDTGECPSCGSYRTGRILYGYALNSGKTAYLYRYNAGKKGEFIKYVEGPYETYKNAYCDDCGIEYHAEIRVVRLTKEEWEKRAGGGAEKIKSYSQIKREEKRRKKEEKRERNKTRRKRAINYILGNRGRFFED